MEFLSVSLHLPVSLFLPYWQMRLLACLGVAAHELIYAAGGIYQLRLTRVEGVRGAGDFQLDEGISLAFELNGLVGLASGAAEEHIAIAHVLEHDGAIVFGMDVLLHVFILYCYYFLVSPGQRW